MNNNYTIPKQLHFIWLGSILPHKYQEYLKTWLEHNPDYKINLWFDSAAFIISDKIYTTNSMLAIATRLGINAYDVNDISSFKSFLKNNFYNDWLEGADKIYAKACDSLRMEILYQYGGVYVDIDTICLQPLPDLDNNGGFKVWGTYNHISNFPKIDNCFIAACPQHPLLQKCIAEIKLHYEAFLISARNFQDYPATDVVHNPGLAKYIDTTTAYNKLRFRDSTNDGRLAKYVGGFVILRTLRAEYCKLTPPEKSSWIFNPEGYIEHFRDNSWVARIQIKRRRIPGLKYGCQ